MKLIIYTGFVAVAFLLLTACAKSGNGLYTGEQAAYFQNFIGKADSTTYSFVGKNKDSDTIFLDVRFIGNQQNKIQQLQLQVVESLTTAQENIHYEPLKAFYEFPAGSFSYQLPIILKRSADLSEQSRVLTLELVGTSDLIVAYENRARARIIFSDLIMKPAIWDALLAPVFGIYSKTKHVKCMEIMERPFPETTLEYNLEKNVWKNLAWKCNNYFKENIVMDNDLVPPARILPWL